MERRLDPSMETTYVVDKALLRHGLLRAIQSDDGRWSHLLPGHECRVLGPDGSEWEAESFPGVGCVSCPGLARWARDAGLKEGDLLRLAARTHVLELSTAERDEKSPSRERAFRSWWDRLQDGPSTDLQAFQLGHAARVASLRKGFRRLVCLDDVEDVLYYQHQIDTVERVLKEHNGRVILADEVGLGKTIEAGLVIKDYLVRGLAKKVFIFTPASLLIQWKEELRSKFRLPFKTHAELESWDEYPFVIASLDTAKGRKNRGQVAKIGAELVIVDEAHKLKNQGTLNWKFIRSLRSRFLLLLTATPIQNSIEELYNLIFLVRPGLLSTRKHFKQQFVNTRCSRMPKNIEGLRDLLKQVMVRHRRVDTPIEFTERFVNLVSVEPTGAELRLQEALHGFVKDNYASVSFFDRGVNKLTMMLLERMLTSSPRALADTMDRLHRNGNVAEGMGSRLAALAKQARQVRSASKLKATVDLLKKLDERVIIYTQFRRTQEYLVEHASKRGFDCKVFHGGMTIRDKERVIRSFADEGGILISTDSGAEGKNLQFCRYMINYDLPWNPMKVEQRIGRIHRLGQTKDVHIFNLYYENSIEAYVVKLLTEKIRLFTLVVGELDVILGLSKRKETLDREIMDIFVASQDAEDLEMRFDRLGNRYAQAVKDYEKIQEAQGEVFGE